MRSSALMRRVDDASRAGLTRRWRIAVLAVVMVVATGGAWLLAVVQGATGTTEAAGNGHATSSAPGQDRSARGGGTRDGVPELTDPLAFAEAFTTELWSYDAATTSLRERTAQLRAWMTAQKDYADWESVASQLPSRRLWDGLAENGQRATAVIDDASYPSSFTQALEEDPGVIREAHVYVVTVTGRQSITWEGGGRGGESRAITLAVQCRPEQACRLAGRLPGVAR